MATSVGLSRVNLSLNHETCIEIEAESPALLKSIGTRSVVSFALAMDIFETRMKHTNMKINFEVFRINFMYK